MAFASPESKNVSGDGTPQFPLFYVANIHRAVFQSRTAKRAELTWTDFSSTGFTRTDTTVQS